MSANHLRKRLEPDGKTVAAAFGVFVVYNAAMKSVAADANTVLVSMVSVWNVVAVTTTFGGSTAYSVEGYSPVGGVVSFVLAYVAVAILLGRLRGR